MVLQHLVALPFRVLKMPFRLIILIVGGSSKTFYLPIAGLSETQIHTTVSSLHHAASSPQQKQLAEDWLSAVQIGQVGLGLLLSELNRIDDNLKFWEQRLQHGGHFWFALLRHGPGSFLRCLTQLLPFGKLVHHHHHVVQPEDVDAGELVERRVLLFTVLRTALYEALGRIQDAAKLLDLQTTLSSGTSNGNTTNNNTSTNTAASSSTGVLVGLDGNNEFDANALFDKVKGAVETSMAQFTLAFETLHSTSEQTLLQHADLTAAYSNGNQGGSGQQQLEGQGGQGGGGAARSQVLGLQHMQRLWSSRQRADHEHRHSLTRQRHSRLVDPSSSTATDALMSPGRAGGVLAAAQNCIGFRAIVSPEETVHDTLEYARRTSYALQRTKRLIHLPEWAPMPSNAQRYWIRYTVAGAAAGYGAIFLIRHSPICGSTDLTDWVEAAVKTIKGAWEGHVIEPLGRVQAELFDTFRRRPAIVSMEEYEADRDSLDRMLNEFKTDYVKRRGVGAARVARTTASSSSSGISQSAGHAVAVTVDPVGGVDVVSADPINNNTDSSDVVVLEGMELMMRSYEQELKRPIKNLVSGDLLRSLLIQVQKLKVDTESAMLEIDQILKANELNVALIAAIPAFVIAGVGLYGIGRFVTPAPPDPKREAVPARMAMIEVERSLSELAVEDGDGDATEEQRGVFLYKLAVAYNEADALFRKHRGLITTSATAEWPRLEADLMELASSRPIAQKLRTANRMMRVYSVYQQF